MTQPGTPRHCFESKLLYVMASTFGTCFAWCFLARLATPANYHLVRLSDRGDKSPRCTFFRPFFSLIQTSILPDLCLYADLSVFGEICAHLWQNRCMFRVSHDRANFTTVIHATPPEPKPPSTDRSVRLHTNSPGCNIGSAQHPNRTVMTRKSSCI